MYSRVIVPLDGSELAEGVLPHVAEVIRGRGSLVWLLAVAPLARGTAPVLADLLPSSAGSREEKRQVEQGLMAYLQDVAGRLGAAAGVQVGVRFGRPADEILAFAGEVEADLVAMSTHGRSGIGRWVFGSVADRVLRGAACPVLLVQAGRVLPQVEYRRLLVPLDGSELAEQVLPYIGALVRSDHTRVFLVSVLANGLADRPVTLLTSYPAGLQLPTTAVPQAELQLRTYLRSVAAALRDRGAAVRVDVRRGSPAEEILACAAEVEADLIGMTTHGLSGVSQWVYGNVAGKVLHGAHSPVLLVRPVPG